ncbi:MAG: protein kinase, partial [Wujia sp.]
MNYPMTLEQYIVQMPMREVDLVRMGAQIADALAAIHQQGSVHGNVKPGNILITAPGTYQLIGMESVRQYPEGTIPVAVAPELEQGGTYQAGTDVYALGMMMKSLIPRQGVSGVLDEILRKACEPDPARRYTTALEFAEELQTLADLMQDTVAAAPQAVYEQPNPQSYEQPYTQPVSHAQQPNPQSYEQPYTQPVPHAQQPNPQSYEQPYTQPVHRTQQPTELVGNRHPQEKTDSYRTRPQEEMHLQPKKEKYTKQRQKKQKESLALHFLLPILLVLIIGAAVAVYVILIRPSN